MKLAKKGHLHVWFWSPGSTSMQSGRENHKQDGSHEDGLKPCLFLLTLILVTSISTETGTLCHGAEHTQTPDPWVRELKEDLRRIEIAGSTCFPLTISKLAATCVVLVWLLSLLCQLSWGNLLCTHPNRKCRWKGILGQSCAQVGTLESHHTPPRAVGRNRQCLNRSQLSGQTQWC